MWTRNNVQLELEKARGKIEEFVEEAVGKDKAQESNHIHYTDSLLDDFCSIDEFDGQLDSPCFRLGRSVLKLHLAASSVRAKKRGKRIICYATCCYKELDAGCMSCDRLSPEFNELHFIDPEHREPIQLGGKSCEIHAVKVLLLTVAGHLLQNEYLTPNTDLKVGDLEDMVVNKLANPVLPKLITDLCNHCNGVRDKLSQQRVEFDKCITKLNDSRKKAQKCLHKMKLLRAIEAQKSSLCDTSLWELIIESNSIDLPLLTAFDDKSTKQTMNAALKKFRDENFDELKETCKEQDKARQSLRVVKQDLNTIDMKTIKENIDDICKELGLHEMQRRIQTKASLQNPGYLTISFASYA